MANVYQISASLVSASLDKSPYFEHNDILTGMLWKLAPPGYEE
jgi:hypothetical protein